MLTYHTYNKEKDVLKVGAKIRLAGREGEILAYDIPPSGCVSQDSSSDGVLFLEKLYARDQV